MTLTYNLYHCDQLNPVPSLDVTTTPLYQNLKAALGQPHFLREGGVLGFACQHSYVFEEIGESKDPKILLKGSDRMVMLAATSLGLEVEVKSIVSAKDFDDNYDIQECLFHCQFHYEMANKDPNFGLKYIPGRSGFIVMVIKMLKVSSGARNLSRKYQVLQLLILAPNMNAMVQRLCTWLQLF